MRRLGWSLVMAMMKMMVRNTRGWLCQSSSGLSDFSFCSLNLYRQWAYWLELEMLVSLSWIMLVVAS